MERLVFLVHLPAFPAFRLVFRLLLSLVHLPLFLGLPLGFLLHQLLSLVHQQVFLGLQQSFLAHLPEYQVALLV